MATTSVPVPGASLSVVDQGAGEPVLFVQTALTADELEPLATDPALVGYRRVSYRRRGYAPSTPVTGAGSIVRDAADAAAVLRGVGVDRAHVVGLSFSAAIALQLAADAPGLVATLTLIEPPPVRTPSAAEFRAANDRLLGIRREHGPDAALEAFLTMLIGDGWPRITDERLPGSGTQMRRDAATFFDTDLPALVGWRFDRIDAARVVCPILYLGGAESGPWFADVRQLVRTWFPDAAEVIVAGADHSLAVTHAADLARALAAFLQRHPL